MYNITIRTGPVNSLSIDELTVAVAHFELLADRIVENGHTVPSEITQNLEGLRTELNIRLAADKRRRLQVALARRDSLLTRKDKLAGVDAEIASLQAELGLGAKAAEPVKAGESN